MTLGLVVLGRHVERLKFLDVMFGDQPALTPAELTYQRLLARDPVEAAEQARAFLRDKPLISYYETIFIPTLKLAHADAETGRLDDERLDGVREAAGELIDDLADHHDRAEPAAEHETARHDKPLAHLNRAEASPDMLPDASPRLADRQARAVCAGHRRTGRSARSGRRPAGGAARDRRAGRRGRSLSMSRIFSLDTKDAKLICLSYVENVTPAQIRYSVRRLRRKAPDAHILVILMGETRETDDAAPGVSYARGSLEEALDAIVTVAANASAASKEAAAGRLASIERRSASE